MSSDKEMDTTLNEQNQLMANMSRLYENYKKDGPSRRTVSNITNKLIGLDGFWQEFQNNHKKLMDYKDEDYTVFAKESYAKTKAFYESARSVLEDHLNLAKQAPLSPRPRQLSPKPTERLSNLSSLTMPSWHETKEEEEAKKDKDQTEPLDRDGLQVGESSRALHQDNGRAPKAETLKNQEKTNPRPPINPVFAIPPIFNIRDRPNVDAAKLSEKMRKQQSNFKAFARTIYYIDLSVINERWELDDLLKSVQSHWANIDALHWDIDSELFEDGETYNQTFCKYEKKFQDVKKTNNTKTWSMTHREKSTPVMDIPPFNGNYQGSDKTCG